MSAKQKHQRAQSIKRGVGLAACNRALAQLRGQSSGRSSVRLVGRCQDIPVLRSAVSACVYDLNPSPPSGQKRLSVFWTIAKPVHFFSPKGVSLNDKGRLTQ